MLLSYPKLVKELAQSNNTMIYPMSKRLYFAINRKHNVTQTRHITETSLGNSTSMVQSWNSSRIAKEMKSPE
jgi:hypothetical protein